MNTCQSLLNKDVLACGLALIIVALSCVLHVCLFVPLDTVVAILSDSCANMGWAE